MSRRKSEQARVLILSETDIDVDKLIVNLGVDRKQLINILLNLCDSELYQQCNPFYGKKVVLDSKNLSKLKIYYKQAEKKLSDSNYSINRELVETSISLVNDLVELSLRKKKRVESADVNYSNVIENLIFETNDIRIFKIIANKQQQEFKNYFNCLDNYGQLIEKYITKIKNGSDQYYLLAVIKILAYIANTSSKKNDMISMVNMYYSKIKSIKGSNKKAVKKYMALLKEELVEKNHTPSEIIESLNLKYGIAREFDLETLQEVQKLVKPDSETNYKDFTRKKVITLDQTAMGCLEDAISIEKLENGNYLMGLYVINPYSYIPNNTSLEKTAFERGQSIYIRGSVIPMFPDELSYNILSLLEGDKKRVLAHMYEFSSTFDLISFESHRAIIKVHKNYSFESFDKNDHEEAIIAEQLYRLMASLKKEYSGIKNYYNKKNQIKMQKDYCDVVLSNDSFSNELINYIKIFANHTISKNYSKTKNPFIYCVNEKVCNDIKTVDDILSLNTTNLANETKTCYSLQNSGHKTLRLDSYAKVTTPVRNFIALKNQQLYEDVIIKGVKLTDAQIYKIEEELTKVAEFMNRKQNMIQEFAEENDYYYKKVKKKIKL